ncbi:MAG: inositol 2-dehydrogenase [Deltaproteobacteria bacterium RBG_13_52_11b]|nr:MAG: inositol 2-dehydrogenase [Deltaproteobacteria bacterium RBG_13_52_11b]
MGKVNVGVIGAGRIGRIHARNLKFQIPGAKLLAIADVIAESAQTVADELEIPLCEQNYHRLLGNDDIQAVVICSSTDTHAQIMMEAAEAGKHIFCEKPIALEMDKIDRALLAVDKAKVKLQVGFNRRFDPSFRRAKMLVESGKIGIPQLLRISSRDPQPPPLDYIKVSGGLFLDMMIHDFDMARYLLGEEVTELMATGTCLIDSAIGKCGDVDTAVVLLKFKGGALGTIDNSRQAVYGYDQRIEVFGSKGSVAVENKTPTEVTIHSADAIRSDKPLHFFLERYQEAYLAEMNQFITCVLEDKKPPVGGADGKISVAMGYAAMESVITGTFVKVTP